MSSLDGDAWHLVSAESRGCGSCVCVLSSALVTSSQGLLKGKAGRGLPSIQEILIEHLLCAQHCPGAVDKAEIHPGAYEV